MMGPRKQGEAKLFYYGVNLGKRVPEDHILRRIDELVDWGFVRKRVAGSYGSNGHVSEDPIVIVKLMFLLFFEDVKSERELMRTLPMRLDWLWFLGMDLASEIPDHSVLSKARKRWGTGVFEELFVAVVRLCVEAGLVGGGKIHVDGSLVDADASRDSVKRVDIGRVYRETEGKLTKLEVEKPERQWVSETDPEAVVVGRRRGKKGSRPRYKHHRAVDDAVGVITAVKTTRADVSEPHEVEALIEGHEESTGEGVQTVVGDGQYGTHENYRLCARKQIRCHLGDVKSGQSQSGPKHFTREDFQYDPVEDVYRCPGGEVLIRSWRKAVEQRGDAEYRMRNGVCPNCPLKEQCTTSKHGRRLKVPLDLEWVEQGRRESLSPAGYRDRRRRKYRIEGSFGDATRCHHFKRARWRGLEKQSIQDSLIAVCQNLRILCSRGWYLNGYEGVSPIKSGLKESYPLLSKLFQRFLRPPLGFCESKMARRSEGRPHRWLSASSQVTLLW